MVTSDFRPEVEISHSRSCASAHRSSGHNYRTFIVDVAMGRIPRSTERSSNYNVLIRSLLRHAVYFYNQNDAASQVYVMHVYVFPSN